MFTIMIPSSILLEELGSKGAVTAERVISAGAAKGYLFVRDAVSPDFVVKLQDRDVETDPANDVTIKTRYADAMSDSSKVISWEEALTTAQNGTPPATAKTPRSGKPLGEVAQRGGGGFEAVDDDPA